MPEPAPATGEPIKSAARRFYRPGAARATNSGLVPTGPAWRHCWPREMPGKAGPDQLSIIGALGGRAVGIIAPAVPGARPLQSDAVRQRRDDTGKAWEGAVTQRRLNARPDGAGFQAHALNRRAATPDMPPPSRPKASRACSASALHRSFSWLFPWPPMAGVQWRRYAGDVNA